MNRREFIRRGVYLAGAFACLPSGAGFAEGHSVEWATVETPDFSETVLVELVP